MMQWAPLAGGKNSDIDVQLIAIVLEEGISKRNVLYCVSRETGDQKIGEMSNIRFLPS